jgi:hypothetical protein
MPFFGVLLDLLTRNQVKKYKKYCLRFITSLNQYLTYGSGSVSKWKTGSGSVSKWKAISGSESKGSGCATLLETWIFKYTFIWNFSILASLAKFNHLLQNIVVFGDILLFKENFIFFIFQNIFTVTFEISVKKVTKYKVKITSR